MENLTNSCSTISLEERNIVLWVFSSVGLASTVSCIFALLLTVWFKLYKRFVHRLAAYQVLSSLFFSVICSSEVLFVGYDADSSGIYKDLCAAVGFLLEYSVWVKLLFMLWLTVHLFCFTVYYKSSQKYERLCVAGLILFPLLFIWVPFIHGVYGLAGAWCWIQNWKEDCAADKFVAGVIEQYLLLHGPLFVTLVVAMALIIVMLVVLVKRSAHSVPASELQPLISVEQRRRALKELISLVAYPVFFFLLMLPTFFNRFYGAITKDVNFASFISSGTAIPAVGFFSGMTLIVHVVILKRPKPSRPVVNCTINGDSRIFSPDDGVNHCAGPIGNTQCKNHLPIFNESDDSLASENLTD